MKLTCLPEQMAPALSIASKVAAKRSDALPILERVLIETTPDGRGQITATDLRATVVTPFSCRVDDHGSVALLPDSLGDFLEIATKGEPLTLTSETLPSGAVKISLTSGAARARLPGMHGEEFPTSPTVEGVSFRLPADMLKDGLGSVLHGVAPDESRPVMAGVHCVIRDHLLTLEAVDGFRGATRQIEVEDCDEDVDTIITGKGLRLALASLQSGDDVSITLDRGGKDIEIVTPAARWIVGAIDDGVFPNMASLLTKPMTGSITCRSSDLKRAIALAMGFGRSRGDKGGFDQLLALKIGAESITVIAASPEAYHGGDLEILQAPEGSPKSIAFNAAYLRDAVNALDFDRITIETPEGYAFAIVREPGARNGHIQYVGPMNEAALQRILTWRGELE